MSGSQSRWDREERSVDFLYPGVTKNEHYVKICVGALIEIQTSDC